MLDQLTELIFSEDESNYDLAMTLAKGLDISSWQLYLDLKKCNEFFANHWARVKIDLKQFLKLVREKQFVFDMVRDKLPTHFPDYLVALAPIIEKVSLHDEKITAIPACVYGFYRAKSMSFRYTSVSELSDAIWELPALEQLSLVESKIFQIRPAIAKSPRLQQLELISKHYVSLPDTLPEIPKLETLWWGSWLTKAPNQTQKDVPAPIYECKQLQQLMLVGEHITRLENKIGHLRKLKKLVLHNTLCKELPERIGDLEELEHLSLSGNELARIPPILKILPKLKTLTFDQENIRYKAETFLEQLQGLEKLERLTLPKTYFFESIALGIQQRLPATEVILRPAFER